MMNNSDRSIRNADTNLDVSDVIHAGHQISAIHN